MIPATTVPDANPFPIQPLGPSDDFGVFGLFPPCALQANTGAGESTRTLFFHGTRRREPCEPDHNLACQLMPSSAEVGINPLQTKPQRLMEFTVTNQRINRPVT